MAKFQMHAPPDKLLSQHGAAPGGTMNFDANRVRTIFGMSGNQDIAIALVHNRVPALARLYFKHRAGWEIAQVDTALNFRTDHIRIDLIA